MAAGSDTAPVRARLLLPDLIERGRDTALSCPLFRLGAAYDVASGTYTLRRPDGSKLVDAATVAVASGVASYTVVGTATTGQALGDGWVSVWDLTGTDGARHVVEHEAALVRRALYPVVTESDLYRREPSLRPGANAVTSRTDYSDEIDEAWVMVQRRLLSAGRRPWLVLSPDALREPHLCTALSLVFEGLAGRSGDEVWARKAETYRDQAERAWKMVRLAYDEDEDGTTDARVAANPVIWLTSRRIAKWP